MGARGNSGVILSQIIRGIGKSVEGKDKLSTVDLAKALKGGSDTAYKAVIKPVEGTILTVIRETAEYAVKEGKDKLSTVDLAKALKGGSDTAYKAVIKPVEGTILTVIRETAEYAVKLAKRENNIEKFLGKVVREANVSLENTPNLLKNLKDAGVVDSGGKGLTLILEGFYLAIVGKAVVPATAEKTELKNVSLSSADTTSTEDIKFGYCTEFILESDKIDDAGIRDIMLGYGDSLAVVGDEGVIKVHVHTKKFGYCTEFILESDKIDDAGIRDIMLGYGDSLAVVGDEGVIKVHVHTNEPGNVLQEALKYGQLLTIKIENMRMQHENILEVHVHTNEPGNVLQEALKYGQLLTIKIENMRMQHENILDGVAENAEYEEPVEEKEFAFISTSMGDGLASIFKDFGVDHVIEGGQTMNPDFGVDHVIEGGQTMNPSTEDFMKAIDKIHAKNIFILPNNSNIIMAANQAKELSDKNIIVIPTKNIPQAVSALVGFNPEATAEENEASNIIMAANQAKELSDKNIIVIPTKNIPQAVSALVGFNPEATAEENEAIMVEELSYS